MPFNLTTLFRDRKLNEYFNQVCIHTENTDSLTARMIFFLFLAEVVERARKTNEISLRLYKCYE